MAQENLKKAITVVTTLVEQGEKSFADGFQAKDAFDFIPGAMIAADVDWKLAIEEAKTRTKESNAELLEFIKQDFDLENDVVEEKVEAAIEWILVTDNTIRVFSKK